MTEEGQNYHLIRNREPPYNPDPSILDSFFIMKWTYGLPYNNWYFLMKVYGFGDVLGTGDAQILFSWEIEDSKGPTLNSGVALLVPRRQGEGLQVVPIPQPTTRHWKKSLPARKMLGWITEQDPTSPLRGEEEGTAGAFLLEGGHHKAPDFTAFRAAWNDPHLLPLDKIAGRQLAAPVTSCAGLMAAYEGSTLAIKDFPVLGKMQETISKIGENGWLSCFRLSALMRMREPVRKTLDPKSLFHLIQTRLVLADLDWDWSRDREHPVVTPAQSVKTLKTERYNHFMMWSLGAKGVTKEITILAVGDFAGNGGHQILILASYSSESVYYLLSISPDDGLLHAQAVLLERPANEK